MRTKKKPFIC